jgi:hypothetical protein
MSEHRYWTIVSDLARIGHVTGRPKGEISTEIIGKVHEAAAAGEHWAVETLARWAREGASRDYTRSHGSLNTTTYVRANGRRVRKTTSYSLPKVDSKTGDVVGHVQASFWDYEKAPFTSKRAELAAQEERISDVVAAMDQVLDAWKRSPDSKTARIAWEADGHTTTEIDLAEAV